MITFAAGEYSIEWWNECVQVDAPFHDRIDVGGQPGSVAVTVRISHRHRGPLCRFEVHADGGTCQPVGMLLIPESGVLFVGCDDVTVAVDVQRGTRLWTSDAGMLFWTWLRTADTVVMVGELELVAYDLSGRARWRAPIEPPHDVGVEGDRLVVAADAFEGRRDYRGSFLASTGP